MAAQTHEYTKTTELHTCKGWILWHTNYTSIKVITSLKKKNPKCVNIKQGILEETFHKSKSILGRHQAFQTMKLNKTKLRTWTEIRAVWMHSHHRAGPLHPDVMQPGSWQLGHKCTSSVVPKFMFAKMVPPLAAQRPSQVAHR